jgi:hydrogenase maturation protease
MSSASSRVTVIGVGNSWSGDDAAGVLVARSLRGRVPEGVTLVEHEGEPTALIDTWQDAELAIVVDATCGGGSPGTVRLFDATSETVPSRFTGSSTHAFTVAQAIELGRALDRLPTRLVVVGIEGRNFQAGASLEPVVAAAVDVAAETVLERLDEHLGRRKETHEHA